MKWFAKGLARAVAAAVVWPAAALSGFGRVEVLFLLCGEGLALAPGILGYYLRAGYYRMTLEGWGRDCCMEFGSWFAHANASVGDNVDIGAYCILGSVELGDRTIIGSDAQILSGTQQHVRAAGGRLTDEGRVFRKIRVGADCWIGAGAIVMAALGRGVTVAPGAVVSSEVQDFTTVAGNPARAVMKRQPEAALPAHQA
ncbi:MAG TPA: acyltransferase [Terriglobales bacterium]|jgi:acetyltransferase-like isoleucine patch superfamily enzyme